MKQVLFFRISLEVYSKTSPSEHFMRRGKTTDGRAPFSDDDVGYIYKKMRAQLRLILLRTTQRPQKTTYTHRAFTCDFNIFFSSLLVRTYYIHNLRRYYLRVGFYFSNYDSSFFLHATMHGTNEDTRLD